MDNLTHTLTGLLLSRAGLNRFHPQASWILVIAANAPDFDAVTMIGGGEAYFLYHRALTHAIVMVPVMALLPSLMVRVFFRKKPFRWLQAWILGLCGIASHLLLDLTNPYGIRLFLPFDNSWPRLAITNVIDVWIWSILLLATLAPMLGRLVSSEIGAKTDSRRGWAIIGLVLFALYDAGRWISQSRAIAAQEARIYSGEAPRRALAYPSGLSPLKWQGFVETGGLFSSHPVDLLQPFDASGAKTFYKPESTPAIEAAAKTPIFRTFTDFSRLVLWRSAPSAEVEGGTRVEASDLYFGFGATALVDSRNQVVEASFHF